MLVRLALYARVSSSRQADDGTIESQIASLRDYCVQNEWKIDEDLVFLDNGVSGTSLTRPGLEAMRDRAFNRQIDKILILSPDRLSRKYAHQLLLIDEFQKLGVEVVFVNRSISQTPEDQLLFQVQGVIAEYEREKIIERSRRGKMYKAKLGRIATLSAAPYGYLYVPKDQDEDAKYIVNLKEAEIVKNIFNMYANEELPLCAIMKFLNTEQVSTRKGLKYWRRSTIYQMLTNPAYIGKAAFRKTAAMVSKRPNRRDVKIIYPKSLKSSRKIRPQSEWITINVPAIVDENTFEMVQRKFEENKKFSKRNQKYSYLLSGLLRCKNCGYAMSGMPYKNNSGTSSYLYYRCIGKIKAHHPNGKKCSSPNVRADVLDQLVWEKVRRLIVNPKLILQEYSKRLNKDNESTSAMQTILAKKKAELKSKEIEKERLVDLYQLGTITKQELGPRLETLRGKIAKIENEANFIKRETERNKNHLILVERFEAFFKRTVSNVERLSFEKRRQAIRLVTEAVWADTANHSITIDHILPVIENSELRPNGQYLQADSVDPLTRVLRCYRFR